MISIVATRGAATKLRTSPFTETAIEGVHSVVYKPGIEAVPFAGDNSSEPLGSFGRGVHRISGVLFSYHGSVAETLLAIAVGIDLIVRYRANGQKRKRTFSDVLFVGDASIAMPSMSSGMAALIAVPFRVQIPLGETVAAHVADASD